LSPNHTASKFSKTWLQYPNEFLSSKDWKHGFIKESGLEDYKLNGNQEAFGFIPKKSL
jgi:hypothetical protein